VIVLDASVVVEMLGQSPTQRSLGARLATEARPFHVPHLLDAEIARVLQRFAAAGAVSDRGGRDALLALGLLPLRRHGHGPLLGRVWQLRANLTAYDALYVALAERLGATLLTRDARLARAPGIGAAVEIV
jgi:predicted nucleic acid-binding protein